MKIFCAICLTLALTQAVSPNRLAFLDRATLQHSTGMATVHAAAPRPLHQAVQAIREEYGWSVGFEDPRFQDADLTDDTDIAWNAAHPGAKGVRRIAGSAFFCTYSESPNLATSLTEEETVLHAVVLRYNVSGNPGQFSVRNEGAGRFSLVGERIGDSAGGTKTVKPLLDTAISVDLSGVRASDAIRAILSDVSAKTGVKAVLGGFGNNLLQQSYVDITADNVEARRALRQVLDQTKRPILFDLLFDPDFDGFFLNVYVVSINRTDSTGKKLLVPIDRPRRP